MSEELAILCQACGLCCDGSLFGRVDLEGEETARARKRGLRVVAGGTSFEQPCSALVAAGGADGARRSCSTYDERPAACRRFTCRLRERLGRGGSLEEGLATVRRTRALLAGLDASNGGRRADGAHAELTELIEEHFARSRA